MMIHYTPCSTYSWILYYYYYYTTYSYELYREQKMKEKKKVIKNLDRHTTMWNAARHPVYNDRNRVWTDCSEYNNSNNNTIK